eukprot:SAG31_NODE_3213_length_4543_cov_1.531503_1_plen_42_part_00
MSGLSETFFIEPPPSFVASAINPGTAVDLSKFSFKFKLKVR